MSLPQKARLNVCWRISDHSGTYKQYLQSLATVIFCLSPGGGVACQNGAEMVLSGAEMVLSSSQNVAEMTPKLIQTNVLS